MLNANGLKPHNIQCDDLFQFGKGDPLPAKFRSYWPTGVGHSEKCFLLGAAVVDAQVLIRSHNILEELQAIIDLPEKKVHLQKLNVSLPLVLISGHLTICIDRFPSDANAQLKQLSHDKLWHEPNPSCLVLATVAHSIPQRGQSQCAQAHAVSASNMADSMETDHAGTDELQEAGLHLHGAGRDSGNYAQVMASRRGSTNNGAARSPPLRPSRVSPLRQCDRVLRPMHDVQSHMEVGHQSGSLARFPWIAKLLYTVATIATDILDPYGAQVQAQATSHQDFQDFSPRHGGKASDWGRESFQPSTGADDGFYAQLEAADLGPDMAPEERHAMQQDIHQNMDYYMMEHQQDPQRLVRKGQVAQQLLQASSMPIAHPEEEEAFDWEAPTAPTFFEACCADL